jgi:hypothetical protein
VGGAEGGMKAAFILASLQLQLSVPLSTQPKKENKKRMKQSDSSMLHNLNTSLPSVSSSLPPTSPHPPCHRSSILNCQWAT